MASTKVARLIKRMAWESVRDSELNGKVGSIAVIDKRYTFYPYIVVRFCDKKTRSRETVLELAFIDFAQCDQFFREKHYKDAERLEFYSNPRQSFTGFMDLTD